MTASAYGRLTPRMAWQLAAPHTWPAAILPVLVAAAAAAVTSFSISATMVCVLLVICVLMQSAVNTFNDYYDYVKGADSADDNVDPTDAVLVYNNVNPRAALALAVGFLAAAFLLGAYVIWIAGWIPLAIGAAGAVLVPAHRRAGQRVRDGRAHSAGVLPGAFRHVRPPCALVGRAHHPGRGAHHVHEQHVRR